MLINESEKILSEVTNTLVLCSYLFGRPSFEMTNSGQNQNDGAIITTFVRFDVFAQKVKEEFKQNLLATIHLLILKIT